MASVSVAETAFGMQRYRLLERNIDAIDIRARLAIANSGFYMNRCWYCLTMRHATKPAGPMA
jgi:hypothetical protein